MAAEAFATSEEEVVVEVDGTAEVEVASNWPRVRAFEAKLGLGALARNGLRTSGSQKREQFPPLGACDALEGPLSSLSFQKELIRRSYAFCPDTAVQVGEEAEVEPLSN